MCCYVAYSAAAAAARIYTYVISLCAAGARTGIRAEWADGCDDDDNDVTAAVLRVDACLLGECLTANGQSVANRRPG